MDVFLIFVAFIIVLDTLVLVLVFRYLDKKAKELKEYINRRLQK